MTQGLIILVACGSSLSKSFDSAVRMRLERAENPNASLRG